MQDRRWPRAGACCRASDPPALRVSERARTPRPQQPGRAVARALNIRFEQAPVRPLELQTMLLVSCLAWTPSLFGKGNSWETHLRLLASRSISPAAVEPEIESSYLSGADGHR